MGRKEVSVDMTSRWEVDRRSVDISRVIASKQASGS